MRIFFQKKAFFLILILNIALVIFAFKDLPRTFYQQDEWMGLGRVMSYGLGALFADFSFLQIISATGRFLARPINYLFYKFFPFQIMPFVIFSFIFHSLNSLLVFILAQKLTKKIWISAIASIFFAVATVSRQSLTWAGASTTTLPAATFIFLSLIFYLTYLEGKKKKFLYLSCALTIVSIFFKESGLFLYLFIPLLYFFYKEKPSIKEFIKLHQGFLLFGIFIICFRFFSLLTVGEEAGGLFATGSSNTVGKLILRAFLYPLTSFSQIFLPDEFIFSLAKSINQIQYPFINKSSIRQIAQESVISDMISLFFSFCLLLISSLIFRRKKEKRIVLFTILLIFTSVLPYIILDRGNAYLESRYFYIAVAGGAIFLGLVLEKAKSFLGSFLIILLLTPYLFWQINLTQVDIQRRVVVSQERKKLLSDIRAYYPVPPRNPIFFVTGNDDFYMVGNKIPFQQGVGYTLMVLYYDAGIIPKKLLQGKYLWRMLDQGYKEVGDQGFGYFWEKEKLKEEFVKNNQLMPEQVIGFYYFGGEEKKLVDITDEIRNFLTF